jgi:trk system potassium uptake protein TrkA
MRVVIAGAGHAGLSVAAHLQGSGHDVTVIDRDEAVVRRALEHHGLVALAGDATSARVLRDADVRRVMVRMRETEYRSVYAAVGVHRILSETDVLIGALATAIEHEAVRHSMLLGTGDSLAFEIVVPADAHVVGRTVREIAADPGFPPSCVFAALSEAGAAVEVPRGTSVVTAGMALLLIVKQGDVTRTVDFFMARGALG